VGKSGKTDEPQRGERKGLTNVSQVAADGDSPSTDVALSVATKPKKNLMYETILVTLDGTPSDRAIIEHIKQLAKLAHSRLVLLHVADGWAARTYGPDAVSPEITEDTTYLEKVQEEFQSTGIPTESELAYGDPVKEIIKWVEQKGCDLVAMSTHGHRFLADLFLGTTATRVQHSISIPVLLLRAK
jgi:universal stress protein A